MKLQERLNEVADNLADKEFERFDWDTEFPQTCAEQAFISGFQAAIPIIVKLSEALNHCANRKECDEWSCCASCGPIDVAAEALADLEKFIEENK